MRPSNLSPAERLDVDTRPPLNTGTAPGPEEVRLHCQSASAMHNAVVLMHGHWDIDADLSDALSADDAGEALNTGIGAAVPVSKIIEVIHQERFAEARREEVQKRKTGRAPTP